MNMDKTTYMTAIIYKLLEDIKAKEMDYGTNGAKVQLFLGWNEARTLLDALEKDGKDKINVKEWLSSFNTDSATECFTAVQRLKEAIYENKIT